jgi:hypothetical protein
MVAADEVVFNEGKSSTDALMQYANVCVGGFESLHS